MDLVPTAKITLDKPRTMRMDLNALSDFENMTGKSIMRGDINDFTQLGISDVTALLWACLVQEDESLSLRDVGRMIGMRNLEAVTAAITQLTAAAMPEPKEGSAPGPLSEKAPASASGSGGTTSGEQRPETST